MDTITQTNRSILFMEINPEKYNLLTMIGDVRGKTSLDDEKMKTIHGELLVGSMEEFMEKFHPVVYSWCNPSTGTMVYCLNKPEGIPEQYIIQIPLSLSNDLVNMLITLQDSKQAQGAANVEFTYEKMTNLISPEKVMDDVRQVRKEIQYTFSQYSELDKDDPKRRDLGDRLNVQFEQASQNYMNITSLLPLLMEDCKTRLLMGNGETGQGSQTLRAGLLSMGEDGELKILEMKQEESTKLAVVDDQVNADLVEIFKEDFDALNENSSSYARDLVVRTFCPLSSTMESSVDVEQEVRNYNSYLTLYSKSKSDFANCVKPLIQKILGVKSFFDQYQVKERGMEPKLLITNTNLDLMVKSANLPRLLTFLNTTNLKNEFTDTIWFGIVPDISISAPGDGKLKRLRFEGNQKVEHGEINSMENLAILLNALIPYRIITFFGFATGEETTFNYVATEGIAAFRDRCAPLMKQPYSEFAVPCLPNITLIPKNRSGLILDKKMVMKEDGTVTLSEEKEDLMKMWLDGFYINAAFPSAGIVAAWQCPNYLKQRYHNTSMEYPGIRFDVEAGDNAMLAATSMAKEIRGYTIDTKNTINHNGFAFIFTSDNARYKDKEIRNIMVYKARNLLSNGTEFEPIYKTLVVTYIERMLRFYSNDFKQDKVLSFFSNNPSSQKSQWDARRQYVNSILQEGDQLDCSIDEKNGICNIRITFSNTTRNLKVELTRSTGMVS